MKNIYPHIFLFTSLRIKLDFELKFRLGLDSGLVLE